MKICLRPVYFLLAVFLAVPSLARSGPGPLIRLADYQFDPLISRPVTPAPRAKIADPSGRGYYLLQFAGVAPEASLVFQARGDLSLLPAGLNQLFAPASGGGARIHNISWGDPASGRYTSSSEDVDEFSWDNKEFAGDKSRLGIFRVQ